MSVLDTAAKQRVERMEDLNPFEHSGSRHCSSHFFNPDKPNHLSVVGTIVGTIVGAITVEQSGDQR